MERRREWILPDPGAAGTLRERILGRRGVVRPRDRELFAGPMPRLALLHDPGTLPGVDQVAGTLDRWIREGLRVAVYGDYDADGLCATSIMARALRLFGAAPRVFIPHRIDDGYGLSTEAIETLHREGVQAVVTVDCGIRSFAEARRAAELGMPLAITDHHAPKKAADGGFELPEAVAIAHPSLGGCPFEAISGSVVAMKVAKRLVRLRTGDRPPDAMLRWMAEIGVSLAALGLVPDVMPLVDENRVLVAQALPRLRAGALPGIPALMRAAGKDPRDIDAGTLAFTLGPMLNAAGRLDDPNLALRVLETDDAAEAATLAPRLHQLNLQRRERADALAAEAEARVRASGLDAADRRSIAVGDAAWHPGLIGLVAARLVERFHRPTMVFGGDGDAWKGSGRSVPGVDLDACLGDCAATLERFGGHAAAAGGSVRPERFAAFADAFEVAVKLRMPGEPGPEPLRIDVSLAIEEALQSIDELESLQPFGKGFPPPLLHCPRLRVRNAAVMGQGGKHLKVQVNTEGTGRGGSLLMWGEGGRLTEFRPGRALEVVGAPRPSNNPRFTPDFQVRDLRFTD